MVKSTQEDKKNLTKKAFDVGKRFYKRKYV